MLPSTFWLVTNYTCNNRCQFCYAKDGCSLGDGNNEIMEFKYACSVLEEMKKLGAQNCLLIGGEPTLYPQLIPLVSQGHRLGLQMKLVSNGRKLANWKFVRALKEAGLVHASVSIEASAAERHNTITQTPSFQETLQGAKNLLAADISANSIMTVSALNISDVVGIAELMHSIGMPNILYNFSLPSVEEGHEITDSFALDPKESARVITEAYIFLKKKGIRISFFATLPLCLFSEETLEEMRGDMTIGRDYHCHVYYGTGAAFEPNGNVLPCTHFVGSPLFNAKQEDGTFTPTFADQWENGVHMDFIEEAWHYPAEACERCKWWGKCFAGCPFLWTYYNPEDYLERR